MSQSSLFVPGTNGPAVATSTSPTPFVAAAGFECRPPDGAIQWLGGYWAWVVPGGETTPNTCALRQCISPTDGPLIPDTTVVSGTLKAGQWNFITLSPAVPLALATPYLAGRGWNIVAGFPETNGQFGTGGPYVSGIPSGSLFGYSDGTGGGAAGTGNPAGIAQGTFSIASADPSAVYAVAAASSSNFWVDILTSSVAPAGFTGPYELFPNNTGGNIQVTADLNAKYNAGTEFHLSAPCPVLGIKYVTPPGATQLATRAGIWSIDATGLLRLELAAIANPSWSGAAGINDWVTALFSVPPILPPGKYVAAVYNANASGIGTGWLAKDSQTGAYGAAGPLANGIVNGPLSAPSQAAASVCYDYNGSNTGATPPYNAGTTEPGQCCFGQMPDGSLGAPYLYAGLASGSNPQNYFVSPLIGAPLPPGVLTGSSDSRSWIKKELIW